MAMQLAYYRIYGRFTSTYETQQTRAFAHGRTGAARLALAGSRSAPYLTCRPVPFVCFYPNPTETGRTLSDESIAFVRAMQDPAATAVQRAQALRAAIDGHITYMADAANGKAFDRCAHPPNPHAARGVGD
jgi:carnitine O-acetyltransferase